MGITRAGQAWTSACLLYTSTDLPQKFGIPRNSFLAPHLQGRIVFEPEFALPQAVAGLEEFSHLWLLWEFENGTPGGTAADIAMDTATASKSGTTAKWTPTVRPPRLGGSEPVSYTHLGFVADFLIVGYVELYSGATMLRVYQECDVVSRSAASKRGPVAVSYTHLDVYKRQVGDHGHADALVGRHQDVGERGGQQARLLHGAVVAAVSYTHLP